jgi:hypothetical protein
VLELAPLLGRVARAVGGDRPVELRRLVGEPVRHDLRHELDRLARLDEADAARAAGDEVEQHVSRLAQRAAALLQRLVDDRRVPHRDMAPGVRRAVAVHERDVLEAGQALGKLDRVGDRGARQQDPRRRPVRGGDPAQPAQHVGHVRAEHAAVDVRLVDHDDSQVREEVRPRLMVGQDPDVEHVGVGQHEVRAPADRGALLPRRVAVVDRRAHGLAEPERVDRTRLVLRERLRGVEVERARLGVAAQDVQRRQVEAQRLARRRPRRDDRRALPRSLQRLRLMGVQLFDARRPQALQQLGVQVVGQRRQLGRPGPLERLPDEPPVFASRLDQRGPRLGLRRHWHLVPC